MCLDLHVGRTIRARLRRACQRDLACRLDVRRLLENCALDVDIARLRAAADLDLAVACIVDVPVACTRADIDCLPLRHLFERELLADIDFRAEIEIIGFDLRIVGRIQRSLNRELLPRRHLDVCCLRLEPVDVLRGADRAVLNNGNLHMCLILEFQIAFRHIGSDVRDCVRLCAEIHRAFAEKKQVADGDRCTLRKPLTMQNKGICRRPMNRPRNGKGTLRQDACIVRQIAARDPRNCCRAGVFLISDADITEVAGLEFSKSGIRHKPAHTADREAA